MKRFLLIFVLIFMLSGMVFFTGCKKSNENNPADMSIVGVKWILETIQYSTLAVVPVVEIFYIQLNQESQVEMEVDCNYCAGGYSLGTNNSISFDYSTIACTEADCGADSLDDEFHDALETATRYEVDGNRLRIYFDNEQSWLNFVAESS